MTPRDRQLATLRRESTDRISLDAICIENVEAIASFLGIRAEEVHDRLGIDGRIVSAGYLGQAAEAVGEWGTPNTGDYGTARPYPLSADATIAQVEGYPWPSVADYDYPAAAETARALGRYAVRGPYWLPVFCRVADLVSLEEALASMLTRPDVFEAVLERVCTHTEQFCARLLDACGEAMPILCLGDDFATQRGLMMSPELWRRFLKPRYARLFELGKRRGKFVWFHSCGDITPVLGDLIDIGIDVWETVQLHALPCSPQELKREFGKHVTFFGGVNTQRLPFIGPDEVRAEVAQCIEVLGESGGYICGPDHHIKPDVPPANAVALFDAALTYPLAQE